MTDLERIRELARETREFALSPEMERRRRMWTNHNSLDFTRPPIYIRSIPSDNYLQPGALQCNDPEMRNLEALLLRNRYCMQLRDDTIIEPFLTVRAVVDVDPNGVFGLPSALKEKADGEIAAAFNPSVVEESDMKKLHVRPYKVDEEKTARRIAWHQEILDGILDVAEDRQAPLCCMWYNDISTMMARLRGLEEIMWDVYDRPEFLEGLVSWMCDCILEHIDQTEAAGGFRLCNHQNQAMSYCHELEAPSADRKSVSTKQLWGYMASQEFTVFGTEMFDQFMFRYQERILSRYGLASYGCCEDLTHKLPVIKRLKNLRRIAVSPFADAKLCAEQIGSDYVLSWRPNPATACSNGIDEAYVRDELRRVMDIYDQNHCIWDVTLKDLETTSGDPTAIVRWTDIIRDELEKHYG